MPTCAYGHCTMRNLCKGEHCVRKELERDGYTVRDGVIVKADAPPSMTDITQATEIG